MYVYSQSAPRARRSPTGPGAAVPNHSFASFLVMGRSICSPILSGEEQVVLDLLFGEPEIEQLVIAHHPAE